MVEATQQSSATSQKRITWLGIAAMVTGVLLGIVKALVWSHGFMSPEVEGYAAGAIIIPSLIAYAIAGRKAKRNWDKFSLWFAGLSLFFLLQEFTSR